MNQLLSLISSFGLGVLILPVLIIILNKANIGDIPGGRKIHSKFTPSMGGIAIIFAGLVSFGIWGWHMSPGTMRYVALSILIMFFIGIRDDFSPLSAFQKILMQLGALFLIYFFAEIRVTNFYGFLGIYELPEVFSFLFTIVTLFAITNAYNLIDGIDGLAGTIASIPLLILGFWFDYVGYVGYSILCFGLLGAILAFLSFNWHPAKIFMGDTGSLPLGFALAVMVVAFMNVNAELPLDNAYKIKPNFSFAVAMVLIPLFDMARVFAKRLSSGKHPMKADKNHLHHLLVRFGMKQPKVVLLLVLVQLAVLFSLVIMRDFSDNVVLPLVCALVLSIGLALEAITPKFLKIKIMRKVPKVYNFTVPTPIKPKMETEDLNKMPINMN
ncbi:MraY family glycosyltransferase [uncultured Algoriphagus sp.]|uniref:MraY family glycosyltransferase n=1 Tax=uncultured Algoriphagus sp. TaxID=417365 RepID=UPI0030EEBE17|tara:strand:+ start:63882 stop:65033 length:1152 start_codon:yes stop_codon:yes gene_type:complete